jgi:hypothetical protein
VRKGAPEGRVAPACSLVGFGNLRARAETASAWPVGNPEGAERHARGPADSSEKCLKSALIYLRSTWARRAGREKKRAMSKRASLAHLPHDASLPLTRTKGQRSWNTC